MSAHSLVIQYSASARPVVEDGYWLRLEQEPLVDDSATTADAARLFDEVFKVDPCIDDAEAVAEKVETVKNGIATGAIKASDVIAEAAKSVLDLAVCDQESDGSVEVEIKIIQSHPNEPYQLRISGGEVVETTIEEIQVSQTIAVADATSLILDYPVVSGFSAQWSGNTESSPAINRNGNTLYWSPSTPGTLVCSYLTRYALVRVKVLGVDGERGEALVRCFFHGLVEEMTPDLPEPVEMDTSLCEDRVGWELDDDETVTCYQTIVVSRCCSCSKKEIDSRTYDQVVPCPEWAPENCPGTETNCIHQLGTEGVTEYVPCANDGGGEYNDPNFYKKNCCVPPPFGLPTCGTETRSWQGGVSIEGGVERYRQAFGPKVRLAAISPPGGICGTWTIKQEVNSAGCCDGVNPLEVLVPPTPTTIGSNTAITVHVSPGLPPYSWEVNSPYRFAARYTLGPSNTLYINDAVCANARLKIKDQCSQVNFTVTQTSASGTPVSLPEGTVVAPDTYFLFSASGGTPPFLWSAGGGIEILSVSADSGRSIACRTPPEFCGGGDITVTDLCGQEAAATVQSTAGAWVQQPWPDHCVLPPGFSPIGPDSPLPPLCGGTSPAAVATSGGWRVSFSTTAVGFVLGATCPPMASCGWDMFPAINTWYCQRYSCFGQSVSGGHCCIMSGTQSATIYQTLQEVLKWVC